MLLTLTADGLSEHQISGSQNCWLWSSADKMSAVMRVSKPNKAKKKIVPQESSCFVFFCFVQAWVQRQTVTVTSLCSSVMCEFDREKHSQWSKTKAAEIWCWHPAIRTEGRQLTYCPTVTQHLSYCIGGWGKALKDTASRLCSMSINPAKRPKPAAWRVTNLPTLSRILHPQLIGSDTEHINLLKTGHKCYHILSMVRGWIQSWSSRCWAWFSCTLTQLWFWRPSWGCSPPSLPAGSSRPGADDVKTNSAPVVRTAALLTELTS